MKFRMAEKSLFAILLRSPPWWISLALAAAVALVSKLALPATGGVWCDGRISVRRDRCHGRTPAMAHTPNAARVQQTLEAVRAMVWRDFAAVLEAGWQREGYAVSRLETRKSPGADFALVKAGQTTLVSAKRWKAASLGVEPLRELQAAMVQAQVHDGLFVTLGEVTPRPARLPKRRASGVLQGPELTTLLQRVALEGTART